MRLFDLILPRRRSPRVLFQLGPVAELPRPWPRAASPWGYPPPTVRLPIPFEVPPAMALLLRDTQQVTIHALAVDGRGNPVSGPLLGNPEWGTDRPEALGLSASPGGGCCSVSAIGPIGGGSVWFHAELPDGKWVVGRVEIEVIASEPTDAVLLPGAVRERAGEVETGEVETGG